MKCVACGHEPQMHWHPSDPPLETTACRDCLPRELYTTQHHNGALILKGICCRTSDAIEHQDAQP